MFLIAFSFCKIEFIKKVIPKEQSEASESNNRKEVFSNKQKSLTVSFLYCCDLLPIAQENGVAAGGTACVAHPERRGPAQAIPVSTWNSGGICLRGTKKLHSRTFSSFVLLCCTTGSLKCVHVTKKGADLTTDPWVNLNFLGPQQIEDSGSPSVHVEESDVCLACFCGL